MNITKKLCGNCEVGMDEAMVCTGCRKVSYCSQKCQKAHWPNHKPQCKQPSNKPQPSPSSPSSSCTLTPQQLHHLLHTITHNYLNIYKLIYLIDQTQSDKFKARNTYYYGLHKGSQSLGCCSGALNTFYIPEKQMTVLETIVYESTKESAVRDCLNDLLEFCGRKMKAVKDRGLADGLGFDEEAERYLVGQVMTEACQCYFLGRIRKALAEKNKVDSIQPMLFATANTWYAKYPKIKLEFLEPELLRSLNERGYGMCLDWSADINSPQSTIDQLSFLEKDGRFDEPISQQEVRNDRIMWFASNKTQFPSCFKLASKLYSIPFELNTKCQFICVISETIQVSYFKANGFHKPHLEGSFQQDSGKKFSILYSLGNIEVILTNVNTKQTQNLKLKQGSLLIFKSRSFACQLKSKDKSFLVRYWINGPIQSNT